MSFLHITYKDLLISIRDRESWLILILMPIILTIIFSAVFGGENDNLALFPISVGIVNLDQSNDTIPGFSLSTQFLNFLESDKLQEILSVSILENEVELKKQIQANKINTGILLPENFTSSLITAAPIQANLKIYGDADSTLASGIIQQIMDGFLAILEANRIRIQTTMTIMAEEQVNPSVMQQVFAEMISNPETLLPVTFTQQIEAGKKRITSPQYYAAAMAVMFLLFTANMGIFSILEERTHKTILRLKTGHLNKFSLLLGKFLMIQILGIVQVVILILFTHLVLKVAWADSIAGLIYITLAGTTAISALAIFISAITKNEKAANAINWIAIQVLAFLGGSYFPIQAMPPFLQTISKFTVNGRSLQGYLTLMEGGRFRDVLPHGLVLFGFGAVFLILGSIFFRYSEEGI